MKKSKGHNAIQDNPPGSGYTSTALSYTTGSSLASTTRGNCQRYQLPYSRLQCHQQSFFPSTIRLWNELPQEAVSASTVDAFKTSLPTALHYMYMYIDVFNCTYTVLDFNLDFGCCFSVDYPCQHIDQ